MQGNQGAVGKQTGQNLTAGFGEFSDLLVTELQPRYYQNTYRGSVFGVTFASGSAAAASATATGAFSLFNPLSSGKNLVLIDAIVTLVTFSVTTTFFGYGLAGFTQTPTTVTLGNTPVNQFIGGAATSVAKTYTVGTLVGASTATVRQLAAFYPDLAAGDMVASIKDEIAGVVVVQPGSGIDLVSTTTAGTATQILSYTWAEILI